MTVKEAVLEDIETVPAVKQQEVLDFVQFLKSQNGERRSRRSLKGIWADFNVNVTEQDLREARNEMWRGYTKDTEDQK